MLLIDIGNTCLKWTTGTVGEWTQQHTCFHKPIENKHELFNQLWRDLPRPAEVWVANVAGEKIAEELNNWTQQHWQLSANFVQTARKYGDIYNDYDMPEQLGIDRWLAVIAARHLHPIGQLCVIDCGTAITVDVLTQNNHYAGGLIVPGNVTMQQTLLEQTDALAGLFQQPDTLPKLLATNTTDGIRWGCSHATVGFVYYIWDRLQQDVEVTLLLTGGGVDELLPLLPCNGHYVPELVLLGLSIVAKSK